MDLSAAAKGIFRTLAPKAASYFGTPIAGMAVKSVLDRWLGTTEPSGKPLDAKAVERALANLTPEEALALQKADQEFALQMEALGIKPEELRLEAERVAMQDRASAREREIKTGDWTPRILAYITLLGFFAVLAAQFQIALSSVAIPEAAMRTMDITTGVLFAMVLAVKDYYFGSSAGSKEKTDTMAQMAAGRRRIL